MSTKKDRTFESIFSGPEKTFEELIMDGITTDVKWTIEQISVAKRCAIDAISITKEASCSAIRELSCLIDRLDLIIENAGKGHQIPRGPCVDGPCATERSGI